MNKFDGNFVQSLQGDEGLTKICEASKEMHDTFSRAASHGGLDNTCFSSWCNFGLYDVDFGWGKPMWVSCVGATLQTMLHSPCTCMNTVILTDTRSRDGVEAWVDLSR